MWRTRGSQKEAVAEAVQARKSKVGVNGLHSVKWGTALKGGLCCPETILNGRVLDSAVAKPTHGHTPPFVR